jgi:DNA-binding transcriptional ArsR family regulator
MVLTADPTRLDRLFRAFADRTRRRILKLLGGGEIWVGAYDIQTPYLRSSGASYPMEKESGVGGGGSGRGRKTHYRTLGTPV